MVAATGALSSAVLVANNLRDIPTDRTAGKITLAVRLGDGRTRMLYQGMLVIAGVLTLLLAFATPWCVVGLVAAPLAVMARLADHHHDRRPARCAAAPVGAISSRCSGTPG